MAWPRWYHITLTIHSHLHARTHMQNDAHRRLLTAVYVSWTEASGYNVQLLTRPHQHNFYGYHTPHKLTTITQTACSKRNKGRITKHPVTNKDVTPQVCSCETQLMKKPTLPTQPPPTNVGTSAKCVSVFLGNTSTLQQVNSAYVIMFWDNTAPPHKRRIAGEVKTKIWKVAVAENERCKTSVNTWWWVDQLLWERIIISFAVNFSTGYPILLSRG